MDKKRLEGYANNLRNSLGFPSDMPISIHHILKKKNIQAYFHPLDKNLLGMAVKQIDEERHISRLFMMINTEQNYDVQRFTAGHELYHLLYQESNSQSFEDFLMSKNDVEEKSADYFSQCLLLPAAGIKKYLNDKGYSKLGIAEVLALEHDFRSGHNITLGRLLDLGYIDTGAHDSLKAMNIREKAAEYGYPKVLYVPTQKVELVSDYNVKARQLFDMGMISQAKYFSILGDMNIEMDYGEK